LLDSGRPEVDEFAQRQHVNLKGLVDTVREVSERGGDGAHRAEFTGDVAHRLKEQWLRGGPFGSGIFSAVAGRRDA
jgi:hypothetical protein